MPTSLLVMFAIVSVAGCSGPPSPASSEIHPSVEVRVMPGKNSCSVAEVEVLCEDVGSKLAEMHVPKNANIHLHGDPTVREDMAQAVLNSLKGSGMTGKMVYISEPDK
jgi:biopolymer transport protein ExbD